MQSSSALYCSSCGKDSDINIRLLFVVWFIFQNKSAWQPSRGKTLGRESNWTNLYFFFPLNSLSQQRLKSFLFHVMLWFFSWPLLRTGIFPRNDFFFFKLFPERLLPFPLSFSVWHHKMLHDQITFNYLWTHRLTWTLCIVSTVCSQALKLMVQLTSNERVNWNTYLYTSPCLGF